MKVAMVFSSDGQAEMRLVAETDAEKAILAFLVEGRDKRWTCEPSYIYRPGGVTNVLLVQEDSVVNAPGVEAVEGA